MHIYSHFYSDHRDRNSFAPLAVTYNFCQDSGRNWITGGGVGRDVRLMHHFSLLSVTWRSWTEHCMSLGESQSMSRHTVSISLKRRSYLGLLQFLVYELQSYFHQLDLGVWSKLSNLKTMSIVISWKCPIQTNHTNKHHAVYQCTDCQVEIMTLYSHFNNNH